MTDIVERLREYTNNIRAGNPPGDYLAWQAADEIERMRTEVRHLRETVQEWQRRYP